MAVHSQVTNPLKQSGFFFSVFSGCGGNYHKRCAYRISNNCSDSKNRSAATQGSTTQSNTLPCRPTSICTSDAPHGSGNVLQLSNSVSDLPHLRDRRATWSGASWSSSRPILWNEKLLAGKIQVPHTFAVHSYKKPTTCQMCKKLVSDIRSSCCYCMTCPTECENTCLRQLF